MNNQLFGMKHRDRRPLMAIWAILLAACGFSANAALVLPSVPLQSGSTVPPNIWFILDDSGSMEWDFMPGPFETSPLPPTTPVNIAKQAFTRNTIYYNPLITYQPWRLADGSFAPVKAPTEAHDDNTMLAGSIDLTASNQIFFVPKAGNTDLADARQYWRYRLRTTGVIERSELIFASGNWGWRNPVTLASVTWDTANGPVTRSFAQEMQNFATWYSYARTRAKVAKSGASAAFAGLGEDVRVGFTTIWDNNTFDIPVNSDSGLFRSTNRNTWFNRLHEAGADGGTPLRRALSRAGQYFSRSDASGTYGPEPTDQQLACRQNFTILTTDGFWNGTSPGTPNVDGNAGTTITGPNNPPFQYSPVRPYKDTNADTLADVGMNNWIRDLRPDLPNIVPTSAADPAFWQHSVTFGISIGLRGSLNPETDLPNLTTGPPSPGLDWPNPHPSQNLTRIDDLWHAAVNGRGEFIAAADPQAFSDGLKDALATIVARVGSSSNISTNSTSVSSDSSVFLASFIAGQWTGELEAKAVGLGGLQSTLWSGSGGIPAAAARNIFTWNGSAGAVFPTPAQSSALGGSTVVNYLRGDQSNERQNGGTFRDRLKRLGDIVNSSPVFVRDRQPLPSVTPESRDMVYVGANDGMLHAFDARTGVEVFAYVPVGVASADLRSLADTDYPHRFMVDGPLTVSTESQTPGRRILVGSLGRGGRSLFALDVSDPGTFNASKVLWELTDPALGNMLGQPFIAKLADSPAPRLIVANGPNSVGDKAQLLVIDLLTGAIVKSLDTGAGSTAAPNGLSAPRGLGTLGQVDSVYAGDLLGNLWKFDLSSNLPVSWNVANSGSPLYIAKNPDGQTQPISGGVGLALHPDTRLPWVFFGTGRYLTSGDPADNSLQTWYGIEDPTKTDPPSPTIPSVVDRSAAIKRLVTRSIAEVATIAGTRVRAFAPAIVGDMQNKQGWLLDLIDPPSGGGTALPSGERMIGNQALFNNALLAASIIPGSDPCEVGGSGFINAIDAFTGGSLSASLFDIDRDGGFGDTLPGGLPVGSFNPGVGMPTAPVVIGTQGPLLPVCDPLVSPCPPPPPPPCPPGTPGCPFTCTPPQALGLVNGSDGTQTMQCVDTSPSRGRISWREIIGD